MGYWKEIVEGGWSLVEGMRVTVRRLVKPVVTVQYPRKRLEMSPAYRGHIEFVRFPDTGTHRCIACGTCQRTCPTGVIKVQGIKEHARGGKVATHYVIDFTRCSLCGLCVESCPTQTLKFSREYELEGDSRWDGVIDLMERLEDGR
ncbi:NuoI/complex I 23 kDa subunit family protein [Desulfoglaeba alkanexedens]|uniref:NADH-quinone oxidoreductase subunit I n=1 Tax=Desulfoglaeba alkanexedens ALDC TaxID=980445 RepID=A0A4P8L118_9BACT|nr:NADH-quinone oxidoreductase subunit I [Desulfoglaeba alkanexedens]QCQ21449.1 NADH-quinone oxidoreductase subunit I [Desulfoglaeba alkanexedens ALDC]